MQLHKQVSEQHNSNMLTGFDIATGYSKSLISAVVKNAGYIRDKEYLKKTLHSFVMNIWKKNMGNI